jgi:uncharacterized membrane protein
MSVTLSSSASANNSHLVPTVDINGNITDLTCVVMVNWINNVGGATVLTTTYTASVWGALSGAQQTNMQSIKNTVASFMVNSVIV